jgi:hypothetical protein
MNRTRVLTIRYDNQLKHSDIGKFRGAVISKLGQDADLEFHNHDGEGFVYTYPKIQYKRINNKAAIVCINQGADLVGKFLSVSPSIIRIGEIDTELILNQVKADLCLVQRWDDVFYYTLRKWLPFNSDNYREYLACEAVADRIALLERILTANVLSFAKGVGVFFDKEISCRILDLEEPVVTNYKGVKMMSFDIAFKSDVTIPDFVGLGKGVSIGFGMVKRRRNK